MFGDHASLGHSASEKLVALAVFAWAGLEETLEVGDSLGILGGRNLAKGIDHGNCGERRLVDLVGTVDGHYCLWLASAPEHDASALGWALPHLQTLNPLVTGGKHAVSWTLHELVGERRLEVAHTLLEFGVLIF